MTRFSAPTGPRPTTGPSRRCFFLTATEDIERAVAEEADPRRRIPTYLTGVGTAMRLHSPAFYDDMVNDEPTARIYRKNSDAAARRVHEMITTASGPAPCATLTEPSPRKSSPSPSTRSSPGALLRSTGLFAGDAFSELGDLLLDGLNRPAGS